MDELMAGLKSRVVIEEGTGCWVWQGSRLKDKTKGGYGQMLIEGKPVYAHRLAFSLFKGELIKGLVLLHSCDAPSCCNPDHLSQGTQTDNMKDCANKGRSRKGRCGGRKWRPGVTDYGRRRVANTTSQ